MPPPETQTHLVILVHGIRTHAYWMPRAKIILNNEGFTTESTSYGKFSLLKFVLPLPYVRKTAQNRVLSDIKSAISMHKPQFVSVIAHSFGTHVIANIMKDNPDLVWNKVIFCGSVLPENFPVHKIIENIHPPLLNEIGGLDYWPAIAATVSWGYGSVGTHGFNRPGIESRWHSSFRHSDFFSDRHIIEQWVPFLRNGAFSHMSPPEKLPFLLKHFDKLKYLLIVIVIYLFYNFSHIKAYYFPEIVEPTPFVTSGGFSLQIISGNSRKIEIWSKVDDYHFNRDVNNIDLSKVTRNNTHWYDGCSGYIYYNDFEKYFVPNNQLMRSCKNVYRISGSVMYLYGTITIDER
ncbi:MAG: hypothetical protein LCH61_11830 [Proteobacteria bacterium]|nr:hypothetical protein [Pseudomonadota bacterium]